MYNNETRTKKNFMSTLRIVPVVDGIGEAGTGVLEYCTCISVNKSLVFAGRSDGTIEMYQVISPNQPVSVPTVNLLSKVDTSSRRPIVSIQSVGNAVLALTGDSLFFVSTSFDKSPTLFMKGVAAYALREDSLDELDYPSIVISTTKKRLLVYHFDGKAYIPDETEISTGNDLVVRIVWLNSWIVCASSRSYMAVSPFSDTRSLRELLPVDNAPTIGVIRQSNELILTGHEGLGIFLNVHASPSDFPTPAPRSTVPLDSHEPLAISMLGNYMVAITPSDGSVNVFTLVNANDTKLVQSISLPGSCIAGICTSNDHIGVVSGPVMYLLIPVPFETQFKKLIEQKKFQEALEVINYQYPSDSLKKQTAISNFHKEIAWSQFMDGNFSVAFVHFSLYFSRTTNFEELSKLINFFNNDCRELLNVVGTKTDLIDVAIATCLPFLQSQRNVLISTNLEQGLKILNEIDSVMIQLFSRSKQHDELIAFLSQETLSVDPSTVRTIVGDSDPFVVALILQKEGDVKGALQILLNKESVAPGNFVLDLMDKNFESLTEEERTDFLSKVLSQNPNELNREKVCHLLTALTPTSREKIFLSLRITDANFSIEILHQLASRDEAARRVLVSQLVAENKIEAIEELIQEYGSQLKNFLPDEKFPFCRMLLLGKEGKHKEALQIDPNRGEEYINRQPAHTQSDLYLILVSVFFERKDSSSAIGVIEQQMECFLRSPSRLIQIIPPDYAMDKKFLNLLRKMYNELILRMRSSVVEENLGSYSFLNTYAEWSKNRQSNPVVIREDTICAVCNQPVTDQFHRLSAVAVLPNSSIAHPTCIDGTVQRSGRVE